MCSCFSRLCSFKVVAAILKLYSTYFSLVFFNSSYLSTRTATHAHLFLSLAMSRGSKAHDVSTFCVETPLYSNLIWLVFEPWDGDYAALNLTEGEHLEGELFCQFRSLLKHYSQVLNRFISHGNKVLKNQKQSIRRTNLVSYYQHTSAFMRLPGPPPSGVY